MSVLDFGREELVTLLREKLRGRRGLRGAYLFGSSAAGTAGPWSDVDLVLVEEAEEPFLDRSRKYWDLQDLGVPVDVLVYTPAEFAELSASTAGFWRGFAETRLQIL